MGKIGFRVRPERDPRARANLQEPPQVSRHTGGLKFNRIDRLEGVKLGLSAEVSQISDPLGPNERLRESLSLPVGISEI